MTTNDLTAAFAALTASLSAAGNALDALAGRLSAVATRTEAERQHVASLLASLPAIPAPGPLAQTLGLEAALDGLTAARQTLDDHQHALGMLGAVAADQAELVREVRAELLAVAVPQFGPCVICGEPAPKDAQGVHACDVCAPPAGDEPQKFADYPERNGDCPTEPDPEPTGEDVPQIFAESGAEVATVAANPASEPAPRAVLSPVAEDAAASELPDAQRSALSVAAQFFVCAEPGRRYDVKEVIPQPGYEGRDLRRALKRIPAEDLAAAGIATDGQGTFWRI
jgi:hypothetical protein